jgi:conjugal transfer/type IV secretion protein DotA/TraY
MDTACRGIRQAQRKAYAEIEDLYEKYDGDISSEEAFNELKTLAGKMNDGIAQQIKDINQGVFEDSEGEYAGGNHFSNQMASFTKEVGWPGLGLLYSTIGGQMDAISGLQADNSTAAAGFNIDRMQEVGRQTTAATRRVQNDQARALGASNATGMSSEDLGAANRGVVGATGDYIGAGVEAVTAGISDGAAFVYREVLFRPLFNDPGPVATHKIGSVVLGTVLIGAALADVAKLIPGLRVAQGAARIGEVFSSTLSKVKGKSTSTGEAKGFFSGDGPSLLINILVMFLSLLLMLLLLIAFFLVAILPKLPIFFVSFLALEWAIWCGIIMFGTPLWLALNMTTIGNQPGLFSQRAISGLGVLAYVLLFPALVVVAVVISVLAYNLIIPVLAGLLLLAFGGGIMDMLIGIFATPVVLLLAMAIAGYVSITAISRIPPMITNFLGIQAPGSSVSDSVNQFIASPMQYNNTQNPMSVVSSLGKGKK